MFERKYQNAHFPSLLEAARHFLKESGVPEPPTTGCFAAAGPVAHNRVVFTNRPEWNADGEQVKPRRDPLSLTTCKTPLY